MIEWFYGKGGQQFGPIDEVTLSARIATGEIMILRARIRKA